MPRSRALLPVLAAMAAMPAPAAAAPALDPSFGRSGVVMLGGGDLYGSADEVVAVGGGRSLVRLGDGTLVAVDSHGDAIPVDGPRYSAISARGGRAAGLASQGAGDSSVPVFQRLSQGGRALGPPVAVPHGSADDVAWRLFPHRDGGWLVALQSSTDDAGRAREHTFVAVDRAGAVDASFGDGGRRTVPALRGRRVFGVDAGGRLVMAHRACRGSRPVLSLQRLLPDGSTRDSRWAATPLVLAGGRRCRAAIIGLTIDGRGRVLVAFQRGAAQYVLRTTPMGRPDRRFGRRGVVRVAAAAGPPMTAPVATPRGPAAGVRLRGGRVGVAFLDGRGRPRRIVRLPVDRTHVAAVGLHLARDGRRVLLAGARFSEDDPFLTREDYGRPHPALWRFTTR